MESVLASETIPLVLFAARLGCLFSLLAPRRKGCTHIKIRVALNGLTCNEWLLVRITEYLFDCIQSLLGRGIRDAALFLDVESKYPAPLPEVIPLEFFDFQIWISPVKSHGVGTLNIVAVAIQIEDYRL